MSESRVLTQSKSLLAEATTDIRQRLNHEIDELRSLVADRITAFERSVSGSAELLESVSQQIQDAALEDARAADDARKQAEAAAQSEIGALRTRLQTELEAVRAELETTRKDLAAQLADTERDIIAIRHKRDEYAMNLEQAQKRIHTLEAAAEQTARRQQIADARLEEEVQRRTLATTQLEAARQEIAVAKAQAESCRLEAHLAQEQVRELEQRLRKETVAGPRTSPDGLRGGGLLEHSLDALNELGRARHDEILSMLLERLNHLYRAVAVFAIAPDGLRVWKCGSALSAPRIPAIDGTSPVALACQQRTVVTATAASVDDADKLWDAPVGAAIALPIVTYGQVMAVVYAENPPGHLDEAAPVLHAIAETLVERVNQRLSGYSSDADGDASVEAGDRSDHPASAAVVDASGQYASARQARRVKITTTIEILVDGFAGRLIDLSILGAQIVSPVSLRPNHRVRIVLPASDARLNCQARVVWAQLEPSREARAMYRAGIRFTESHQPFIEAVASQDSNIGVAILK